MNGPTAVHRTRGRLGQAMGVVGDDLIVTSNNLLSVNFGEQLAEIEVRAAVGGCLAERGQRGSTATPWLRPVSNLWNDPLRRRDGAPLPAPHTGP